MEQMQKQAEHVGARMEWDQIVEVDLSKRPFRLVGDGGVTYFGDALIIATGAQAKWLNLPSEERLKGKGVSACATCDGFFYRGKKVIALAVGIPVEEALYMTNTVMIYFDPPPRHAPCRGFCSSGVCQPNVKDWIAKCRICRTGTPRGLVAVDLRNVKTGRSSDDT